MRPEISCERVRKIYGRGATAFEAVNAATFSVDNGEFVSLLGPSGCGKSTLLMMIAGLEAITDGRVFAGGTPVVEPRAEIGIVFQDPTLLPWKTALDNVLFPIEMMRRSRADHAGRAAELLRMVGLHREFLARPQAVCRRTTGHPIQLGDVVRQSAGHDVAPSCFRAVQAAVERDQSDPRARLGERVLAPAIARLAVLRPGAGAMCQQDTPWIPPRSEPTRSIGSC